MRVLYILYPESEDEPRVILSKDLRRDQVRGPRHEIARTHRRRHTHTDSAPTRHGALWERGGPHTPMRSAGAKDTAAAYLRVNLTMPLRHCLESSGEKARSTGVVFVTFRSIATGSWTTFIGNPVNTGTAPIPRKEPLITEYKIITL